MKSNIKFQKLSAEIRSEIEGFHNERKSRDGSASIDESMAEWFETRFDAWVRRRFGGDQDSNKRKHVRLDVEIPIRIIETLIESSTDEKEALDLVGNIVNISKGGLYFKYRWPIEISSIIKVQIELPAVDRDLEKVEALAMVVRVDQVGKDEWGIGLMFSSIYDSDKFNLDVFILNNLSYHLYTGK